jgi:hypothetical protein
MGAGMAQFGAARAEAASRSCSRTAEENESTSESSTLDTSSHSASDTQTASANATSLVGDEQGATSAVSSLDVSVAEMNLTLDVASIESGNEGPTALIVGGTHGDEEAGYRAATQMRDWEPDTGRLVILPKANPLAIEHNSRTTDYGNLNRHFDAGGPTSPLAAAIWTVVEQTNPDVVLSLHEASGVYDSSSSVGQAVFRSPTSAARAAARAGINRANKTIRRRSLMFDIGHISSPDNSPSGLLTERTTYTVGIPSFIVETYQDVSLDTRVKWQQKITRGVLDYFNLY